MTTLTVASITLQFARSAVCCHLLLVGAQCAAAVWRGTTAAAAAAIPSVVAAVAAPWMCFTEEGTISLWGGLANYLLMQGLVIAQHTRVSVSGNIRISSPPGAEARRRAKLDKVSDPQTKCPDLSTKRSTPPSTSTQPITPASARTTLPAQPASPDSCPSPASPPPPQSPKPSPAQSPSSPSSEAPATTPSPAPPCPEQPEQLATPPSVPPMDKFVAIISHGDR